MNKGISIENEFANQADVGAPRVLDTQQSVQGHAYSRTLLQEIKNSTN